MNSIDSRSHDFPDKPVGKRARRQRAPGWRALGFAGAVALALLAAGGIAEADQPSTIVILDGSGSMWGRIHGRPKLEIAREAVSQVLGQIPADQSLGLMAYGHRTRGDCSDIELVVPPAPGTVDAIRQAVGSMRFQGRTPLTESVRQAAEALRSTEAPATVVLVTDGIETCEADPCALAEELERSGVAFTAHVIGFGLTKDEGAQVACIADNTGGRYIQAGDADSLAEALAAAVTDSEPPAAPPAPEAPEPERPRHYPGAEMMPGIALAPTGGTFGEPVPYPAEFEFPPEGTIAQCRAQCEADALCGAWRYEPKGSMFVDHARCFPFSPRTEFTASAYAIEEGWASGMKPDVIGLMRPYVAIGERGLDASLFVPEAVAPGAEFTALWKGPANERDWVDLVTAGHEEFSGELGFFYVNDTIDRYDAPDGAGTLTAPTEPGEYELRYVFGRELDRHVVLRTRLVVGGPAGVPATPDVAEPGKRADAGVPHDGSPALVEATFQADAGGMALAVMWSAVPVPGQDLPPEAWAMQESIVGPVTELFLPGGYEVLGEAGDDVFAGRVDITAAGPNVFTIPRSTALSPGGEDRPDQHRHICAGPQPCRIIDPIGLTFTLPAGWTSDEPFLYETPGGAVAERPTATFIGPDGNPVLLLNPIRWVESNGVCTDSAAGPLCIPGQPEPAALAALAVILPSLQYTPAPNRGAGERFGGTPFSPPAGSDPLKTIVPGRSKP